jgi:tetratricopeptide (TPR) repeat protein
MLSMQKAAPGSGPEPQMFAQALADFRQSVALLEKLIAESPGDHKLRRYLAEALGLGGMGCALRTAFRPEEAEPLYQRTIEIRRELLCPNSMDPAGRPVQADAARELEDLSYLVSTAHLVSGMLDAKGQTAEAEVLRGKLKSDIVAAAARLSGPEFQPRRRSLANQLINAPHGTFDRNGRRDAMIDYELALTLDTENAMAHNNLAWALTSVPDDPWYNPKEGLAHAQKATALAPDDSAILNTVGVAAFRNGDWETARRLFQQSMFFTGGGAHDLFFLAMVYSHEGNKTEARQLYDRAIAWAKRNRPNDPELDRFRAEAAAVLELTEPKPTAETQHAQR